MTTLESVRKGFLDAWDLESVPVEEVSPEEFRPMDDDPTVQVGMDLDGDGSDDFRLSVDVSEDYQNDMNLSVTVGDL